MRSPTTAALLRVIVPATAAVALSALLVGCQHNQTRSSKELRDALLAEHQEKLEDRAAQVRLVPPPNEFESSLERVLQKAKDDGIRLPQDRDTVEANLEAADAISGPNAYQDDALDAGADLLADDNSPTVVIDLQSAIRKGIEHNLDLSVARLGPQITEQQLIQARAVFDTVLFAGAQQIVLDTPRPTGGTIPGLTTDQQSKTTDLATGIRKDLRSGGRFTAQASVQRQESNPPFLGNARFYDADVLLQLEQPLLRGFGSDVAEANIRLAKIATQAERANFQTSLLDLARGIEQTYWQLTAAQQSLLIQQRLYRRTIAMRDKLEGRFGFDFLLADLNEVNARIDARYADLLRARRNVRNLSDQLKRLINDPDLPVIGEAILVPADSGADAPIAFSLLDQVTTALQHRPEIETALLQIDDVDVRRVVADNAQLPILNLVASTTLSGLDTTQPLEALSNTADLDYIDYALGVEFERPFGNRAARSLFEQRTLERQRALENYRSVAQGVTLEVKDALRGVETSFQLIATTRSQRRASALSLEVAEVQLERGGRNEAETFTVRVDRVLARQDALANAELAEAQTLSEYMIAISDLQRATGTSLQRAGLEVESED